MLIMVLHAISFPYIRVILGGELGIGITGVTAGQGYGTTNMIMKNYRYVLASGLNRDPNGHRNYYKFSKLTLNGDTLSEEIISELREYNVLNIGYGLEGDYIRVLFRNGIGHALLFGFK